jgi:protein involved in polysaccharide export with SLBB domain
MPYLYLLFILVAALGFPRIGLSQSSTAPPASPAGVVSTGLIRAGDAVQITVWRKPELSGEFFVANDGSIAHPFYQEVNVGGVSAETAAQRLQTFLELYETSPRVRVDPLYRVSVGGQVRQPKLYTLRPEYTIFEAIDEAGGPTAQGRLGRVRLYRGGEVHRLDLSGANPAAAELRIQSGDRIIVGSSANVFRDVVRPTISFVGSVASLYYLWDRRLRRR